MCVDEFTCYGRPFAIVISQVHSLCYLADRSTKNKLLHTQQSSIPCRTHMAMLCCSSFSLFFFFSVLLSFFPAFFKLCYSTTTPPPPLTPYPKIDITANINYMLD